MAEKA
jgi:hypothetical protein